MEGQMLIGRWPQGPVSSFDQQTAFGATGRWRGQVTGR